MGEERIGEADKAVIPLTVVRNHTIEDFCHCRMKYKLKAEGWKARDPDAALTIGTAVHAALAEWSLSHDEVKAWAAAAVTIPEGETAIEETTFAVFSGYIRRYKDDVLSYVSMETEFSVPFYVFSCQCILCQEHRRNGQEELCAPNVTIPYGARTDGLVEYESKLWVLERKTSGLDPGTFWKLYAFNRQTLGYFWAAQKRFEIPLAGFVIDAMFKPNYKRPEPKFERRFFEPTQDEVDLWRADTLRIVKNMQTAHETDDFYRSGLCFSRFKMCEFYEFCSGPSNCGDLRVLQSTHAREG